ncbi:MAG: hypothetical protein Aurels2KO_33900 [Aureliella sp.]
MNVYTFLADVVVAAHLGYVLFVILGLLAVLVGFVLKWQWVKNPWFRWIHFSMIGIVVVEALLSITCPLTTLENWLRMKSGATTQSGSFVGRLSHELLFIDLPQNMFVYLYCGFGALVLLSLLLVPPRSFRTSRAA